MPHIRIQDKNFESILTHTMLTARFCSSLFTCPQFVLVITHHPYSHYTDLAKPKSGAHIFFFPHVSRAQCLAPARTRTRVIRLRAQCTDHWTTEQSHGIGAPAAQLTMHVKSSTLYSCMVVHPNFFGLIGCYYFV